MPKADLDGIEETNRTGYPAPFDAQVAGRWYRRLAPALGLSDFGASLVRLADRVRQHEGELAALRSQIATVRDQIETAKAPVISLDAARPRERARKAS